MKGRFVQVQLNHLPVYYHDIAQEPVDLGLQRQQIGLALQFRDVGGGLLPALHRRSVSAVARIAVRVAQLSLLLLEELDNLFLELLQLENGVFFELEEGVHALLFDVVPFLVGLKVLRLAHLPLLLLERVVELLQRDRLVLVVHSFFADNAAQVVVLAERIQTHDFYGLALVVSALAACDLAAVLHCSLV